MEEPICISSESSDDEGDCKAENNLKHEEKVTPDGEHLHDPLKIGNFSATKASPVSQPNAKNVGETDSRSTADICDESAEQNAHEEKSADSLFVKFIGACNVLLEGDQKSEKIIKSLQRHHQRASQQYRDSDAYHNVLNKYTEDLRSNNKDVYVYLNDVVTLLKQHQVIKKRLLMSDKSGSPASKRRCPLEHVPVDEVKSVSTSSHGDTSLENDGNSAESPNPDQSAHADDQSQESLSAQNSEEPSTSNYVAAAGIAEKVTRLEALLKQISDEIKKLQAHELTLEEMEQEDSAFIQTELLKKKFMKIFEKVCELQNIIPRNGRAIENKIVVTACRFPEINKKVERFIKKAEFPDFSSVHFLVKQGNKQHNLSLTPAEVKQIAERCFAEVGDKLQKRRHYDFVYNFGCFLTDKKQDDPANDDDELRTKLQENRRIGKSALDRVYEKYANQQIEVESQERAHSSNQNVPNEDDVSDQDVDVNADPPSDGDIKDDDEDDEESEDDDDIIEISD